MIAYKRSKWQERETEQSRPQTRGKRIRQPDAVVLAAILGIDLEHVGDVEIGDGCLVRRDVALVVQRDDRLGKGRGKAPALAYPLARKRRIEALEVWAILGEQRIGRGRHRWVIHRQ